MERKDEKLLDKLQHKYRMVIMQDDTLEEKYSFRLSQMNLYIFLSTILIIVVILVSSAIVMTPLKYYIKGYGDPSVRRNIVNLTYTSDSLEDVVRKQSAYIENIKNVLQNKVEGEDDVQEAYNEEDYDEDSEEDGRSSKRSEEELRLRQEIEQNENFELFGDGSDTYEEGLVNDYFFPPIKGKFTDGFDASEEHFGVDIAAPLNSPVKSIADGMVLLSSWTLETGYTIAIQHEDNMVSFYKHNSVLLKKVGNFVKAGEAVAIMGGTGENSSGPHLHFELWHNQRPVDPTEYINFN
ncbi:MAG: M23 family metallopeptidase [Chitinophagales bacterium]